MKKIMLLTISLVLTTQYINAQQVVLDSNGVTIKWTGANVPSPYFIQASPRGTLEWFAIVNNSTRFLITNYAKNIQSGITYFTPPGNSTPVPFNNIVTTLVTDMSFIMGDFNDSPATDFNQPIDSWDVSNVIDMSWMFYAASSFNQNISSWNVSNVANMFGMFYNASAFNQPIGSWNVSNVVNMTFLFYFASAFNQPIGSWNVSNVTKMNDMFTYATTFNQPIDSWDVSNVIEMSHMFSSASSFNQPIGSWNVGNVTLMDSMFYYATSFNQPIDSWNVSNVNNMGGMFFNATAFNQNIGSWNVGNVNYMSSMFTFTQLSTINYDSLLIGWATISPNETPLTPNITFMGGYSNYCNGESARSSIINSYGWLIVDAGVNCSLDTEENGSIKLKLYPNPVLSVLNLNTGINLINQSYTIVDGFGRVVLKGKTDELNTAINVESLSQGVFFVKVGDNKAIKFIKA